MFQALRDHSVLNMFHSEHGLRESLQDIEAVAGPLLCGVAVVCENAKGGEPVDDML